MVFSVETRHDGLYALEFGYNFDKSEVKGKVSVDGIDIGSLVFWNTGGRDVTGWDRLICRIRSGSHRIQIQAQGIPNVRWLNLIRLDR